MSAPTTTIAESERRADLLLARYRELTEGNPGFHYHLHMRGIEHGVADVDSVTSALVEGDSRRSDLLRLVAVDETFQTWRLRLEHPGWWIGIRARDMTPLLQEVIADLTPLIDREAEQFMIGRDADGTKISVSARPHAALTGFVGAHWLRQTRVAIAPLAAGSREKLAVVLGREALGRRLCGIWGTLESDDPAVDFPESEFRDPASGPALTAAVNAVEELHGAAWADAFTTMLGDLDPILWPGLVEVLEAESTDARVGTLPPVAH